MDNRPIGIFDSGLGGLTVVKEIANQLPNEEIIYFGDTARFPYGPRSSVEIRGFVFEIIDFLLLHDVKFIVIACNSASAAALEVVQQYYNVPIIGVIEPGARAAVQATRSRRVGVIGTQATISSGSYIGAIKVVDAGVQVHSLACPDLADFVERNEITGPRVERAIQWYLDPLIRAGIDSLILGCTHYPLLSETISKVAGDGVKLISSAKETARELKEFLIRKDNLRQEKVPPISRFVSSGDEDVFRELGARFLGREIESVDRISFPLQERVAGIEKG
ncbi:MAG: glutamate racemase [Actinobacteria bacterium]|nr:glutamate racemase [Actinomycetota bacterium]